MPHTRKDLEADIRNKLTLPRTVLDSILVKGKIIDPEVIKKAIESIDCIPNLIESGFKEFESKNAGKRD